MKRPAILVNPEDVIILLEDGPRTTGALSAWLKQPHSPTAAACRRLYAERRIARLPKPDRRWCLPAHADPDVALRLTLTQPAAPPFAPTATRKNKDEARTSWWLDRPAEGFTARAEAERLRMSRSRHRSKDDGSVNV